eukprot:scaffold70574_cov14-Tisochrysis_lutea.AAC.1
MLIMLTKLVSLNCPGTLKNSADRNIRLKAQEIRDIQPGDMPPPPTNKAATSYLDVGQLTPTGDFGSRCDDDGGKVLMQILLSSNAAPA